ILLALRARSGTRPYQIGLTCHRWRQDLTLGYLLWLIFTPLVLSIHVLAMSLLGKGEHPFEQLAERGLAPADWCVLILLAVVQAPLTEELTFRGVLQPWLARRPERSHVTYVGAVVVAQFFGGRSMAPALFALALLPGYLLLPRFVRMPPQETQALY